MVACGGRTALRGAGDGGGGPTGFCAASALAPSGACAKATCDGGECTAVLFTGIAHDVAADDTSVFWTTGSSVMKASSCGADVVTLATCTSPDAIVIDSEGVYVTTLDGALVKIPKQGGSPVVLATFVDRAVGLVVSANVVYWTTRNEATQQGALRSVATAGGAVTTLFSGPIDSGLAVDATRAYFGSDRSLMELYLDGSGATSLADNQLIQSIAVDATNVYWGDGCGRVAELNVPIGGGLLSSGSSSCVESTSHLLVADGQSVYWTAINAQNAGFVVRGSPDESTSTWLATEDGPAAAIAVNSSTIFWTDGKSVRSVSPK